MIRISDAFTFKDSAGILYSTTNLLMSLRDGVSIYAVAGVDDYVVVSFPPENVPVLYEIRKMTECSICKPNILWPQRELYSVPDEKFCGFLANKVEISAQFYSLQQLMEQRKQSTTLSVQEIQRYLTTGLHLAQCIHTIHSTEKNYVIGNIEPEEFYVDNDNNIYYYSIYRSCQHPHSVTNHWYLSPELISCPNSSTFYSKESDSFAFALILFQLLTGIYPFLDQNMHKPLTIEQLQSYMLDGISIYYAEDSPLCIQTEQLLTNISPAIADRFRCTFDYCGSESYTKNRPSIEDWIDALTKERYTGGE